MAQVKLSFKGTSGAKMVATRSLQLTVKKATRQQKTLEGQLFMAKDGERTAISSRVAELDQILPQYLGASRAILDYVIFCHQDESLWPMSEPSVLKKKFDEIFEAMKYTKAIDNIKVLRKKQNEELGKYKLLEQQYKIDKDRADRAEKQSRELAAEIETLRGECQELKKEIEQTTRETERLWSQAAVFEQIIGTLNGKRIEAQAKQESINDLGKYIQVMDESDDWLASELQKYEQRMPALAAQIESQLKQHEQLSRAMETCRQQLGTKMTAIGKYQAEKAQYERQLARRKSMIKEIARRHGMRGFDTELDDSLIEEFMVRLGKMSRDQNMALERAKRETREELQQAQMTLNQLGEKRSALVQRKNDAKQAIMSNEQKANAFQAELNKVGVDEGQKAVLESAFKDLQVRLENARTEYDAAAWDEKIRTTNEQLRSVEENSARLNGELIQRTRQAGDLARLEFLQKELKDRQKSLDTMAGAFGDKLTDAIGPQWQPATVERDFQSVLDQATDRLTETERRRDGVSRELEQVEFSLHTSRESLKRKSQELRDCRARVKDAIGDEPEQYPEVVAEFERDRDTRKGDVDNFANLRKYYQECIKAAKEQGACRLCRRQFDKPKEHAQFLERLESLISKAGPQALVDELKDIEEDLRRAREAGPSYDAMQRLSGSEIPSLEAEVNQLEGRRKNLLIQVEEQDAAVKQRQLERKDVEFLSKTVQTIAKYHVEIQKLGEQIQGLSSQQRDTAPSRTLEQIQEELSSFSEHGRALKNTISKLIADKERGRSQITTYELELRDLRSKLADASHQLEKKASLAGRVEECRAMSAMQQETIERNEQEIESLEPAFARARAQYEDITNRGADRERDLQQEASKLADSVHQLKLAEQDINAYIDKGGPEQIARSQREVGQIRDEIVRLEEEQKAVTVAINQAQKQRDQHDEVKRTISDNLRYRRDVRALEAVQAEIAELEAKNAEVDRERFVQEADRMGMRHRKLSAEEASKMGAMKSKDDQLMKLLDDWNTDYKDAAKNFKEAHIKVEVSFSDSEPRWKFSDHGCRQRKRP